MPIYEYRCKKGHSFEVMQRMSDESLGSCTICEAPVQRVFHPVAVHFKGKGFYTTDYGRGSPGSDGKPDSASDSKPEKKDSKKPGPDSAGASKDGASKKSSAKPAAADK